MVAFRRHLILLTLNQTIVSGSMFTGIITHVGTVSELETASCRRLRIASEVSPSGLTIGASIACDGACLTVVESAGGRDPWFDVNVSDETLTKTTIDQWKPGYRINLERPLRVGDELGGHIVSGHVDDVATVEDIRLVGENRVITLRVPVELARFIAPKGSVALNGVSLTVNQVRKATFSVNLIPHTLAVTTWGDVQVNDRVNLEIDTVARYIARANELGFSE